MRKKKRRERKEEKKAGIIRQARNNTTMGGIGQRPGSNMPKPNSRQAVMQGLLR